MITVKRDKRFGFVLTDYEKGWLRCLADAEGGLSEAAVIRRLIRREIKALDSDPAGRPESREVQPCPN